MWSPWNDFFDDAEMPWYAKYDFVEVYDYDQSSKQFNLRWRDDFNTWDTKKWYASDNWGFDNNSSLFMSSQVYVEDGNLVLKMDYNDGLIREAPLHHEVHHEEAHKEKAHKQKKDLHEPKVAEKTAEALAAAIKAPVHHTTTYSSLSPGVHETVVHETVVPVVTPDPVVHEVIDTHRFEAPLVHHASHDVVYESTGYPHHYPTDYGYATTTHVPVAHVPVAHHVPIEGDSYLHDTYIQQQHYPDHYYQ